MSVCFHYRKAVQLLISLDVLMSLALRRTASPGMMFFREFSEEFLCYQKVTQLLLIVF